MRLGHRATLYRDGLININRNFDKAVYEKEDFKRRDRQRSFLSDNSGIESANQIHVRHKEIIIINRCAEIYSQRNSTGRTID